MTTFCKDHGSQTANRKNVLRWMLLSVSSIALVATTPAHAQGADPAATAEAAEPTESSAADQDAQLRRLGVVTVQARRREESLKDAPVAITAIGGDTLADLAVTDFTDLSSLVPSLILSRAASGSASSIY